MNALLETQRTFASALRGASDTLPRIASRRGGVAAEERFQIYRNNRLAVCCHALGSTYPAVQALVGEEFFEYAARLYARRYPSLSGDLNDYGAHFPRHIGGLPETAHLTYLGDVAQL